MYRSYRVVIMLILAAFAFTAIGWSQTDTVRKLAVGQSDEKKPAIKSKVKTPARGGKANSSVTKSTPGEWPQWRGPNRDGISTETGLLDSWPKEGPPLLWKVGGLGS